jgi:hypothetical protein
MFSLGHSPLPRRRDLGGCNGGKFPRMELFAKQERQLSTKRAGIHPRRSRIAMEKNRDLSAQ